MYKPGVDIHAFPHLTPIFEAAIERDRVYRERRARERGRWSQIMKRCNDPKHRAYANYGGRGIRIFKAWQDFETFFRELEAEIGPCPGPGMSLDRKDNDGDYEPGNVRWADDRTQALNRQVRNNSSTVTRVGNKWRGSVRICTTKSFASKAEAEAWAKAFAERLAAVPL